MKKSLKNLTATFGLAGLVVLTGCNPAEVVTEPLEQAVEVMEEKGTEAMKKVGDEAMEAGKDAMDGVEAAGKDAMDAGKDVMDGGEKMMKDTGDAMKEGGEDVMDGAEKMMKDGADADAAKTLDVSYTSPAGPETIAVSMTLADGKVAAITATPGATHVASVKNQTAFAGAVSAAVVGKSLAEISAMTDAIGGASLTTGGFKEAVAAL